MVQKYIALILVLTLSGLAAAPAFAGDYTNTKLLPHRILTAGSTSQALATSTAVPSRTTFSQMAGTLAFAPPQASQAQPAKPAASTRHWTKGGKIMTIIGLSCVAAGGIMMTKQNQTISSTGSTDLQINWKATGAIWIGGGAVLALIGLTRHSD